MGIRTQKKAAHFFVVGYGWNTVVTIHSVPKSLRDEFSTPPSYPRKNIKYYTREKIKSFVFWLDL